MAVKNKDVPAIQISNLLKMGDMYNQQIELDLAAECLHQALVLFRQTSEKLGMARCLNNLGLILVAKKSYDQALDHFNQ